MQHFAVDFLREERGQDLVEYAMVAALIASAAAAGMSAVAIDIVRAFSKIGSIINISIT